MSFQTGLRVQQPVRFSINLDPGSFTLTGQPLGFDFIGDRGIFSLAGKDAVLTYTPNIQWEQGVRFSSGTVGASSLNSGPFLNPLSGPSTIFILILNQGNGTAGQANGAPLLVQDSAGNTYSLVVGLANPNPQGPHAWLYSTPNNSTASGFSVTVTMNKTQLLAIEAAEFTGVGALLTTASSFGTGGQPQCGNLGSLPTGALVLAGFGALTMTSDPGLPQQQGGATTTIAAGSNGAPLPQATINVVNSSGFAENFAVGDGYIGVVINAGHAASVQYGGVGTNQFTTCLGGSGTLATNQFVYQAYFRLPFAPGVSIDPFFSNVDGIGGDVVFTILPSTQTVTVNWQQSLDAFSRNLGISAAYAPAAPVIH